MAGRSRTDTRVVIVGGGFGGLYAAKALASRDVPVTVIDRRNFHLFQPLLYQVAIGALSPGDITSPIRSVLRTHPSARVVRDEVVDVRPAQQHVVLRNGGEIPYTSLVIAAGSQTSYFGNDSWREHSCGLKTIEEALVIRQHVLGAFERAETEDDEAKRAALLTFVVVGGGPTGVELAGAIGELARTTLLHDFRRFDPSKARVILLEAGDRLIPAFPPSLSSDAHRSLASLGVSVCEKTRVTDIEDNQVAVERADGTRDLIRTATVVWAAGVTASSFGEKVADAFGAERDRGGRIKVQPDLSLPGHANVFVIGDLAHVTGEDGNPLPGLAPVAIQQGRYVAERIRGKAPDAFHYRNKGQLAVIGRNRAVCDFGRVRFSGFPAWMLWVFIHIAYLIGFDNKLLVMLQWGFDYFTRKRGARLITFEPGPDA